MANVTTKLSFKKSPKLRFPGYTADWEEKRLGEVTTLFSRRNKKLVDAKVYSVTNTDGFVLQSKRFDKVIAGDNLTGYKIIEKNDFAYNPARVNVGSIAHFKDDIGIISSLYVCFKTNEGISDDFLSYFLQLDRTKHDINVYGEGGVRIYLWYPLFAQIKIRVPTESEQGKIANFLLTIDAWIESLRAQLDQLELYKNGMLQKLFSQEIRFKNENGKSYPQWTETSIGGVFDFLQSNSHSRDQLNYEGGKIQNIHYGDIHTKFRSAFNIDSEVVPFINSDVGMSKIREESYCQEGDLVIADASEDYKDIGKTIELMNLGDSKVVAGLHTFLLRKKDSSNVEKGFSGYFMKTSDVRKQIMRVATGISVLGISKGNLSKIRFKLPTPAEQRKIADFLLATDDLIEAKKKQINQAKEWKKGLLQRMFV